MACISNPQNNIPISNTGKWYDHPQINGGGLKISYDDAISECYILMSTTDLYRNVCARIIVCTMVRINFPLLAVRKDTFPFGMYCTYLQYI